MAFSYILWLMINRRITGGTDRIKLVLSGVVQDFFETI